MKNTVTKPEVTEARTEIEVNIVIRKGVVIAAGTEIGINIVTSEEVEIVAEKEIGINIVKKVVTVVEIETDTETGIIITANVHVPNLDHAQSHTIHHPHVRRESKSRTDGVVAVPALTEAQ